MSTPDIEGGGRSIVARMIYQMRKSSAIFQKETPVSRIQCGLASVTDANPQQSTAVHGNPRQSILHAHSNSAARKCVITVCRRWI